MLKRVGLLLGVLAVGLLLVPIARILLYRQVDDATHLEAKERYLEAIAARTRAGAIDRPNIVLILLDDLGYGDLGSYGNTAIQTPHMDSLAEGGARFTEYYAPSSTCTPSRAGLLTGRYAPRAGLSTVVHPSESRISWVHKLNGLHLRMPAEEILMPEVLRAAGYATGMIGKWHLGDRSPALPNEMGFDAYYGALYSNDMEPFELYRDQQVEVPEPVDQTGLNERYVENATDFIDAAESDRPFFLYYAHNFPHIPLFASPEQAGRSDGGLYGDVLEDVDRGIGEIVAALTRKGILDETLILVTSDNGPWFEGSSGEGRGRKFQTWDGGARVPFIAHWPDRIEAGSVVESPVSGVDVLPTLLSLLELPRPADRILDGHDLGAHWATPAREPLSHPIYFFTAKTLDAVRQDHFKYHRERGVRAVDFGDALTLNWLRGPFLFDYRYDAQEAYDVSSRHPADAARLAGLFEAKRREMETNPRGWIEPAD